MKSALNELRSEYLRGDGDPRWYGLAGRVALDLWDWKDWDELTVAHIGMLRERNAGAAAGSARIPGLDVCALWGVHRSRGLAGGGPSDHRSHRNPRSGYIEPALAAYRGDKERTLELVRRASPTPPCAPTGR